MPSEWVSSELKGIEAAAFRVEDSTNAKLCGMGGQADRCSVGGNCMLDIYVDERKTPLPWREPEQKADWIKQYNSSNWLKPYEYVEKSEKYTPTKLGGNSIELHPFVNPATTDEAGYEVTIDRNIKDPKKYGLKWRHLSVFGYRRPAAGNLTLIVFRSDCSKNYGDPTSHCLRLASLKEWDDLTKAPLHEVLLPLSFTQRMEHMSAKASEQFVNFIKSIVPQEPVHP